MSRPELEDGMRAARGIAAGVAIGCVIWLALVLVAWVLA
jgi:hypothetical protein